MSGFFGGGGSGTPAGASGNIQFNDSGAFGGENDFFYNSSTNRVGIKTATPASILDIKEFCIFFLDF